MAKNYIVRKLSEVEEDRSTCGFRKRLITREDTEVGSVSYLNISDAQKHYHKQTSEFYYVVRGSGIMELNDDKAEISEGVTVFIPPGVRHRVIGDVATLVICIPAFEKEDQFYD